MIQRSTADPCAPRTGTAEQCLCPEITVGTVSRDVKFIIVNIVSRKGLVSRKGQEKKNIFHVLGAVLGVAV